MDFMNNFSSCESAKTKRHNEKRCRVARRRLHKSESSNPHKNQDNFVMVKFYHERNQKQDADTVYVN